MAPAFYDGDNDTIDDDDALFGSVFSSSTKRRHDINATSITSTVTIRVTPREDYVYSWSLLGGAFLLACLLAAWQVRKENKILRSREAEVADVEHGMVDRSEAVSSADRMRCAFRRFLLLAMVARLVSLPVMIFSNPLWLQFVGDTLPEMVFATAWTIMVIFFVQLVGSADAATNGTAHNTTAGVVIQATAYVVYICLVVLELFNSVASVLLYALLCCIYAALLGSLAYFCPKLWTLLRSSVVTPSNGNSGGSANTPPSNGGGGGNATSSKGRGLVVRLYVCTLVCLFVFVGHMVNFAQIIIAAPQRIYWWVNYGLLELLPSIVFLAIMNPTGGASSRRSSGRESHRNSPESTSGEGGAVDKHQHHHHAHHSSYAKPPPGGGAMKRVDSVGSAASSSRRGGNNNGGSTAAAAGETTSLLKGSTSYGSGNSADPNSNNNQ